MSSSTWEITTDREVQREEPSGPAADDPVPRGDSSQVNSAGAVSRERALDPAELSGPDQTELQRMVREIYEGMPVIIERLNRLDARLMSLADGSHEKSRAPDSIHRLRESMQAVDEDAGGEEVAETAAEDAPFSTVWPHDSASAAGCGKSPGSKVSQASRPTEVSKASYTSAISNVRTSEEDLQHLDSRCGGQQNTLNIIMCFSTAPLEH